jgi:SAM-dependent methyltransferase
MIEIGKRFVREPSQRLFLRRLYFYGARFRCPVCRSRLRKLTANGFAFPILKEMDVVGGEYFPNDTCPVCRAHSRTRLVHQFLVREVLSDPNEPLRILHFAPEHGIFLYLSSRPRTEYLTADLDPARYSFSKATIRANVTEIPFPDASLDLVICNHVLEHVPDDRLAMREILRVLRPGGRAIVQVPLSMKREVTDEDPGVETDEERERRFGQHDHIRLYGADYSKRLEEAGFAVEVFDPLARWGPDFVRRNRLNPREKVFCVRKPPRTAPAAEVRYERRTLHA